MKEGRKEGVSVSVKMINIEERSLLLGHGAHEPPPHN
jgi:hypothetical protein